MSQDFIALAKMPKNIFNNCNHVVDRREIIIVSLNLPIEFHHPSNRE